MSKVLSKKIENMHCGPSLLLENIEALKTLLKAMVENKAREVQLKQA
jgi:hypothetical protein